MASAHAFPVRVDASLDAPLSRWLWLIKWVLVIPHYIVLAFLWVAFIVLSMAAMVAIVFTGRYPRTIFEFNVGVLRWTWRVQYYAIGAFGTDRYPPFTLADDPSYPAHLEIEYPERLSRGLALVKWWLLAIPQYIIVGLFTGSGLWAAGRLGAHDSGWGGFGLIGILAVVAAVVLLVTGRYPEQIYDFVLGLNRWVLRVVGYAGLMTDEYPPFRLDMGGHDPGTLTLPPHGSAPQDVPDAADLRQAPPPGPGGWTGGRILAAVAGAVLMLCSVGLLGGSGVALWAQANRHGGYADLGTASYSVPGYAIASDTIGLHLATGTVSDLVGTVRIQVAQANGTAPAFVGIAPAAAAARYLTGVDYATVRGATASPRHLHRACRVRACGPAGTGRHLDRACGRPGHPDPHLGGPRRRLDGGRHERRRLAAGEPAGQRGRHAARAAVDRGRPAGRRRHLPGRRRPADRGFAAAGVHTLSSAAAATGTR